MTGPHPSVAIDERPATIVSGWSLVTALVLAAMTLAAAVSLVAPAPPLTSWILGIFVFVVPGAAIMRLTRLPDRLLLALTSVALSVAVIGLVTVLQAYLHLWSPTAATVVVIAVTTVALVFDPAFEPIRRTVTRSSAADGWVPASRSAGATPPVLAADEPVLDTVRGKAHARPMTIGERVGARSTAGMSLADGGRRLTKSWSIPVARPYPAPARDATWSNAGSTTQPAMGTGGRDAASQEVAASAVPHGPPVPAPVDVPFHLSPLPPPTVVGPPRPSWPPAPVWPPVPRTSERAPEPAPIAASATGPAAVPVPPPADESAPIAQPVRPTRIRIASGRSAATKARTPTSKSSAKPTSKASAKAASAKTASASKASAAKHRAAKVEGEKASAAKAGAGRPATPRSAAPRSRPVTWAAVTNEAEATLKRASPKQASPKRVSRKPAPPKPAPVAKPAATRSVAARSRAVKAEAVEKPAAAAAIEPNLASDAAPEANETPTARRRRSAKSDTVSGVPPPAPSDLDEAAPVRPRRSSSNGRRAPGSVPDGAAVHHNKY